MTARRFGPADWDRLVSEQWPRIVGRAYRTCEDHALAEDIAQEVLVKVFQSLQEQRNPEALGAWIARITYTTTMDALRRRRHEASLDAEDGYALAAMDGDPVATWDAAEQRADIRDAVLRLPDELREVVWLTTYAGMSHSDVAATLGIGVRSVVTRVVSARVYLRSALHRHRVSA